MKKLNCLGVTLRSPRGEEVLVLRFPVDWVTDPDIARELSFGLGPLIGAPFVTLFPQSDGPPLRSGSVLYADTPIPPDWETLAWQPVQIAVPEPPTT